MAQGALRADGEHVANYRRSSGMRIMRRQLDSKPRKIENAGNGAYQVIVRHDLFEIERIEELPLIMVDLPHHHPSSPMFASGRRNHCLPVHQATSATKSAHCCVDVSRVFTSAFEGTAEVHRPSTRSVHARRD